MSRYVDVVITRQTQAITQRGFGLPLIVSTEKSGAYKEYTDISGIGTDYGSGSETYAIAARIFGQTPTVEKVAVFGIEYNQGTDAPALIVAALNDLIKTHNDFYYVVSTEQGDSEVTALANWTSSNQKLYFATSSNKTLGNTLANERAIVLVHDTPKSYAAEAWVGVGAPRLPGSFTWTFKTLSGVPAAKFDAGEIDQIEAANASTYIREGGVNITSKGVTTTGEYIDIIQSQDFITSRMTENVFGLLARAPKIPYTDAGVALVIAEVEKTLQEAFTNGIIATDVDGVPMFEVTAPSVAEIATNNKANRHLPNINWSCTIAGAIESVTINGSLQL